LRRLSTFLVLFLLLSCAKKNVQIDLSRINPLEVLKKAKEGEESIRSVKGLASVSIKTPDRKVSYNQVTVAEEPNLLHLEATAPFGRVVGMVFSDGAKIYVISPEEHRTFDSLQEFDFSYLYPGLPVKITVNDLVNLLLGRLPQEPEYEDADVRLNVESNYIVLTLLKDGKEEGVLWVNPLNYRIEKANINLSGGVLATCKFDDFKDLGTGIFFPKRIELKADGFSISVKYDEGVEVNGEIDRDLFKPKRPLARFEKPF
jgi:outer membrane lipoprotein-sorting protein